MSESGASAVQIILLLYRVPVRTSILLGEVLFSVLPPSISLRLERNKFDVNTNGFVRSGSTSNSSGLYVPPRATSTACRHQKRSGFWMNPTRWSVRGRSTRCHTNNVNRRRPENRWCHQSPCPVFETSCVKLYLERNLVSAAFIEVDKLAITVCNRFLIT